jgi:hypothetical protein
MPKPVTIVATGPRKKKPRSESDAKADAGGSTPKQTAPPSSKPTEQPQPRPAQPKAASFAKTSEPVRTAEPAHASQPSANAEPDPSPIFHPAAAAEVMKKNDPKQYAALWRISRFVREGFILLLILTPIVLLGYGLVHLIRAHTSKPATVVAQADPPPSSPPPQNANPPPIAPQVIPKAVVPDPVPSPVVQPVKTLPPQVTAPPEQTVSAPPNDLPPTQTPQVIPKPSIPDSPLPPAVQTAKVHQQLATPPPEHTGGVAAEIDAYKKFEAYAAATLKEENERAQQLPNNSNTDKVLNEIQSLKKSLQLIVRNQYANVRNLRPGVPEDEEAARALPPMFASRQSATNALLRLHRQIDQAMNK